MKNIYKKIKERMIPIFHHYDGDEKHDKYAWYTFEAIIISLLFLTSNSLIDYILLIALITLCTINGIDEDRKLERKLRDYEDLVESNERILYDYKKVQSEKEELKAKLEAVGQCYRCPAGICGCTRSMNEKTGKWERGMKDFPGDMD